MFILLTRNGNKESRGVDIGRTSMKVRRTCRFGKSVTADERAMFNVLCSFSSVLSTRFERDTVRELLDYKDSTEFTKALSKSKELRNSTNILLNLIMLRDDVPALKTALELITFGSEDFETYVYSILGIKLTGSLTVNELEQMWKLDSEH